ncbi:MAG: transcriptional regulator [Nitrosomonadales bacterium SCN 54-20]|nr:MAG: transcriptional regulator [Nitrosomonadales bacterium SCN 54-20]
MSKIQFIEKDGKKEYAIVPIQIFDHLVDAIEDIEDIALYKAAKEADDGARIPAEVLHPILDGIHPIQAWRNYRGLTVQALAEKAGISKAFLSQIENRKRVGTIKILSSIASALEVSVDLLMDD